LTSQTQTLVSQTPDSGKPAANDVDALFTAALPNDTAFHVYHDRLKPFDWFGDGGLHTLSWPDFLLE
jgi:hypothetical protein